MKGQDDLEVYEFCSAYTAALVGRLSDKTLSDNPIWRDSGPGGMRGFSILACQCLTNSGLVEVRQEQPVVPSHHEKDQMVLLPFPFSTSSEG